MTRIHICESGFHTPDGQNPSYSLMEVDIFGYIPHGYYDRNNIPHSEEPSFSLSIRKNLKTGKFELYKWHRADEEETKEVIASGDMADILKQGTEMWHKYWDNLGDTPNSDFALLPCQHIYPEKDMICHIQA